MTTKAELIAWLKRPDSIRVVLVEVSGVKKPDNTSQNFYFSNKPFTTRSTDTPANLSYTAAVSGGITFSESISLDGSPSIGFGDISLDNRDNVQAADPWLNYIWANKPITILIGDATWSRADFYPVFSGLVKDVDSSNRNSINLLLVNRLEKINVAISETLVGGTSSTKDQLVPLTFGECFNVTPVLIDPATLTYQVHNGPIEDIIEVRDNGAPLTGTSAPIKDLANGKFRLAASPYGTITASVQGYKKANTTYQSKVGSVISSILVDYVTVGATYSLTTSASTVNEGSSVTFTLQTTDVANGTTFPYTITGVTSADINGAALTGNFTVNNNQATLTLNVTADATTETTEILTVSLTNVPGVTASVTINDTSQNASATVTADVTSIVEGDTVTFTITPNYTGTVYWSTTSLTGTVNASDFEGGQVTGSFAGTAGTPQQIQRTVLLSDVNTEGTETFRLEARTTSTSGTIIGSSPTITVTDAAATVTASTASLNETTTVTTTFTITPNFTGALYWTIASVTGTINAADFSDANGLSGSISVTKNTAVTVTKTISTDNLTEGTESFRLEARTGSITGTVLNSATVTITDSSLSPVAAASFSSTPTSINEGSAGSFSILTNSVGINAVLYYVIIPINPTTAADFSTLSALIPTTGNTTRTFTITPVADYLYEPTAETFQVEIRQDSVSGTLLATSSAVTINDVSSIRFTTVPTTITEGSSNNYTITLGSAYTTTTFYWTIEHGTTVAADFVSTSGTLSGTTSTRTFTVQTVADSTTEGDQTFSLAIRTGSITGTIVHQHPTVITLQDTSQNAAVPSATITASPTSPQPEGTTVTFTITTTNVTSGSTLWYRITGTGITSEDFTDNTLEASFTVTGTGTISGTVQKILRIDYTSDAETFTFTVSQTQGGASIGSSTYSITDVTALQINLDAGNTGSYSGSGGTWINLVGQNNATLVNLPAYTDFGTLVFDGVDDYATLQNNFTYTGTSGFSFAVWVMPFTSGEGSTSTTGNGGYGRIVDKSAGASNSGAPTSGFAFRMNAAQDVSFQIGSGTLVASTGSQVPYGNWVHLVVTVTSTGVVNIYKNGNATPIATGTTSSPSTITTTNLLTIGNRSGTQDSTFRGNIAVVKFFTTALTAANVATEYGLLSSRYTTGHVTTDLVLYADAKSYSGSGTAWNGEVNNHNFTLVGTPTFTKDNAGYFIFDGTNHYARNTSLSLTTVPANGATLLAWVHKSSSTSENKGILFNRQASTAHGINVRYSTTNRLTYHWNDASYSWDYNSGPLIPDLQWCMIAISLANNTTTFYIYTTSSTPTIVTQSGITNAAATFNGIDIGWDSVATNRRWNGRIGAAMFYNRALTQTQITQNYTAMRTRFGV